ncbi:TetR/AcrR family transcriptional regulator [Streptomyces sp. FH025]|uniref:TetR/AcrR family transcriptional regulator n=1 Tax=Streptomyces sp. FH025 TaxID=2815937 RepID=UPI001A9D7535|nr:TetR/AcrR family transcriptional regulator [Streptomyces sp. FH025]MBO1414941.1 TetR/AcrR family transcriptional regulator [Streptomyces sp. FH025]
MTATNRREQRRTATRERLLAAALELFASQGYAATTYDHIAERADVGRQTAFNHFGRKEDFVVAWVHRRHEVLDSQGETGASAVDTLADALRALADLNEQEYALAKELHDSGVLHSAFGLGATTPPALLSAATGGWERGEIRPEFTPETIADLVFDAYVTTLSRWLSAGGEHSLTEALLTRLDILAGGFTAG